jgi:two-component system sensor histidine kinase CpxA
MRSLFFKIFIIFWIAQSLIFVISTAVILSRRFPHPASMLDPAFTSLHIQATQALKVFDSQGCSGFEAFAQRRNETLALMDESGKTTCGQVVFNTSAPLASGAEIYGHQVGKDTVWTFPVASANGRRYRFVISIHREEHTWYGDMLHFASPQLPVSIAVGGLTTFVLVMIFTRPVIRLREAARELAHGRLGTRVKEPKRASLLNGDEFDALVHDFNHMAERLESLVNAQKLLLRDVSHELRSPLARASVALELSRDDADPTMNTHLDRIQRETERLNKLISQLLTLSSMEANEGQVEVERVSLNEVIGEILTDANYEARQRQCSVNFEETEQLEVHGRRELIYRAIENVVRNAIRYTDPGTSVDIKIASAQDGTKKLAVIAVSDQGPGIPEDEVQSVFRPFYRVDNARSPQTGGFGVGLAIADRAVKLHKGDIRAFNRDSGGLTIEMRFPATQ